MGLPIYIAVGVGIYIAVCIAAAIGRMANHLSDIRQVLEEIRRALEERD